MYCSKCQNDLAYCVCPDLKERLEALRKCKHIHAPSMVDKPLLENKLNKEQPNKDNQ